MFQPLVSCVCPTYCRPPEVLANAIACFEYQDYPNRELVILDDAGQYEQQAGDRWHLHSLQKRFRTLGEKRNASIGLTDPACELIAVWDSDDVYLPHHLSAAVAAFVTSGENHAYTIPTRLFTYDAHGPRPKDNQYLFHGSWCFTRALFKAVSGYTFEQSGQDADLLARFKQIGAARLDPIQYDARVSYGYRWHDRPDSFHVSDFGGRGNGLYEAFASLPKPWIGKAAPKLERDWIAIASSCG
jgi:glycosyltransferase involved in cell wall biosynthesis